MNSTRIIYTTHKDSRLEYTRIFSKSIGCRKDVNSFSFIPLDNSLELSILFTAKYALFELLILNWISLCLLFFVLMSTQTSKVFKFNYLLKRVRTHF